MKIRLLLIVLLAAFAASCTSTLPMSPAVTNTVTNTVSNTVNLQPGQFELSFSAAKGDGSSLSFTVYTHPWSNSSTTYFTLNGSNYAVTNSYVLYPKNWKILAAGCTSGPTYSWSIYNDKGTNSGTFTMPTCTQFAVNGSNFTSEMLAASNGIVNLPLPFSTNPSTTYQMAGQNYVNMSLNVATNGSSSYVYPGLLMFGDTAVTNASPFTHQGTPKNFVLTLSQRVWDDLVYPNSMGGYGEGYVGISSSYYVNPSYQFQADAYEANETTNVATTALPVVNALGTIHTNGDVDWYRVSATNGQVFTLNVRPVFDYNSIQISWQMKSNTTLSSTIYLYGTTNSVITVTNTGFNSGADLYFQIKAALSSSVTNAYWLSITSP